jgi:glycosyltransferase involved in cell wall biosynthesis
MGWRSQQYGSIERFLVRLAGAINGAGGRMHVAFQDEPASAAFLSDLDADVHVVPAASGFLDRRYAGRVRSLLGTIEPTHVHAHFGVDAYLGLRAARAMGVPHRYFTKHIKPGGWRTLAPLHHRWLASQVEAFVSVSADVAHDLEQVGVPSDKLEIIRFGVDPDAYRLDPAAGAAVREELGVSSSHRLVLSTSHLRAGKGVELLPGLAAALASDPGDTTVLAAGAGPLREELEALARSLSLTDREFRLLGVREDVPALLAAADAFVFATDDHPEGLPLGPLEALASGVPLVSTAVSDLPLVLGDAAWLVAPGDGDELIRATRSALADGRTPEREAAVDKALAGLDPADAIAAHLRLYGLI